MDSKVKGYWLLAVSFWLNDDDNEVYLTQKTRKSRKARALLVLVRDASLRSAIRVNSC